MDSQTQHEPQGGQSTQAFQEIAEAFALLERHRDHIPTDYYNDIADIRAQWFLSDAELFKSPDLMRAVLPPILAHLAGTAPAPAAASIPAGERELIAENARLKLQLEQARTAERAAMQTAADFERMMESDRQESATAQAPHHKQICAEAFVLVDGTGKRRARLEVIGEDTVLSMSDAKGRLRLTMRANEREATLNICGHLKHQPRPAEAIDLLCLGWEDGEPTPFIKLWSVEDGGEQVVARYITPPDDDAAAAAAA